jgi:methylamine dehydrogenase light chain
MDGWIERLSRELAKRTSRRGTLGILGRAALGASLFPLLPVRRVTRSADGAESGGGAAPTGDELSCEYWRYCGLDGFLCGCCGGSATECSPGTVMSPTAWVGTCMNPADGKEYMIAYRDCCGKDFCNQCFCENNKGDLPIYRTQLTNTVYWCFGTQSYFVNCTTAVSLGVKS